MRFLRRITRDPPIDELNVQVQKLVELALCNAIPVRSLRQPLELWYVQAEGLNTRSDRIQLDIVKHPVQFSWQR
jgi:hypothetical protein